MMRMLSIIVQNKSLLKRKHAKTHSVVKRLAYFDFFSLYIHLQKQN